MAGQGSGLTRDEKLENLIMNHSMVFMGMFEEAFSALAEKMTEALAVGAAAVAGALSEGAPSGSGASGAADAGKKPGDEIPLEVRIQIEDAFSGIREEMSSQWPKDASVFKRYVSSPAFDKGLEIVERYDFARPKLTEKLSDEVLASYVFLLQSGDKGLGRMFKELADWQASLPKPPWGH
jgi:hypothetical protein